MAGKFTNERIEQDYEDDDSPNKEPIKIPKDGRKGDGIGCREHDGCRHNHTANDGEHSRTKKKKQRRRTARQEHPRNLDERFSLEEWMGMMEEAGYEDAIAAAIEKMRDYDMDRAAIKGAKRIERRKKKHEKKGKGGPVYDYDGVIVHGEEPDSERFSLEEWVDLMEGATQILSEQESHMEDQYTLEEWIDALQEVGVELGEGNPETKKQRQDFDVTLHPDAMGAEPPPPKMHSAAKAVATHKGRQVYKRLPTDRLTQDFDSRHGLSPFDNDSGEIAQARQNQAARMRDAYKNPVPLPGTKAGDRAIATRDKLDALGVDDYPRSVFYTNTGRETYPSEMDEQYTIEEWMGMMEEAGYNINEVSPETAARVAAARRAQADQQYNKSVELTRQAGQHTEEPGTINATMRQTQRAAGDASRAADKLRDKAAAADAYRRKHSPDSRPAPAMAAADAPKLSAASKRSVGLTENTVARLQELAGIQPLNG
jgi:hypothetical protein